MVSFRKKKSVSKDVVDTTTSKESEGGTGTGPSPAEDGPEPRGAGAAAKAAIPSRSPQMEDIPDLLLTMTTGRVHDDHLVPVLREFAHPLLRDRHRIGLGVAAVERYTQLRGVLLQLVERPGSEGVGANHGRLPPTALVVVRVLGDGCGGGKC